MRKRLFGVFSALALAAFGLAAAGGVPARASTVPATTLGIYTSAEDSTGQFSTVAGQHPNVANYYLDWGASYPTSFASAAQSAGATVFLEVEPWIGAQGDRGCSGSGPTMTTIGANGSSIQSYAKSLGSAIASAGKPVILTFAHEFNVSGQYPWAQGECEGTTAAQWIKAWDAVRSDVDSTANGLAYFMWVPNVFNGAGGTVIDPTPYWPGAANVDMVGTDGYPQSQYNETTFANTFGETFSIIKGLSGESTIAAPAIYIAETNLAPLDTAPYESISSFVSDMFSAGGDGVLEWETAGAPLMSGAQWSELDTALAGNTGGGSPPAAPSAPSVAVSGSGQASVFWKGLSGELEEAAGNANPGNGSLTRTNRGMGALGSLPAAADDSAGNSYVYWEGTNDDLFEAYYNGSAWQGPHDTGIAMGATAQPTVAVTHSPQSSAQAYIFWKGANGNLMEAQGHADPADGALSGPYNRGYGVLGSAPAAGVDASGYTYVYWEGTNGALYEGYYNGTGWVSSAVKSGIGTIGAAPSVTITDSPQSSAQAYVFWRGANGNLMEAQGHADPADGALSGPYNRGYGDLGSNPTAGVDGNGYTYVYWEGTNGDLFEGYYNGSGWVSSPVDLGFGYM